MKKIFLICFLYALLGCSVTVTETEKCDIKVDVVEETVSVTTFTN